MECNDLIRIIDCLIVERDILNRLSRRYYLCFLLERFGDDLFFEGVLIIAGFCLFGEDDTFDLVGLCLV